MVIPDTGIQVQPDQLAILVIEGIQEIVVKPVQLVQKVRDYSSWYHWIVRIFKYHKVIRLQKLVMMVQHRM